MNIMVVLVKGSTLTGDMEDMEATEEDMEVMKDFTDGRPITAGAGFQCKSESFFRN